jgi:hypothetical protein
VVQMRGLLVVCDTRTTHLSLRLDPRVLLYHDPPTSTLQHHFDMFIRMDHILHQTPAHITARYRLFSSGRQGRESIPMVPSASAKAIVCSRRT